MFMEKYNTYFTSEYPNQFFINYLNPFSPASRMAITITYPLLPNYEKDKKVELPEVGVGDVLALFPQDRELLEQNGDVMVMFSFLLDLAKEMVDFRIVESPTLWKYLVVLYTSHNLSLHIRDLKDEANRVSLNNEDVEKNYYIKDMLELYKTGVDDSFALTMYGQKFKEIYYPLFATHAKGGYRNGRKL